MTVFANRILASEMTQPLRICGAVAATAPTLLPNLQAATIEQTAVKTEPPPDESSTDEEMITLIPSLQHIVMDLLLWAAEMEDEVSPS
jgi:hypothetical protein